MTSQLPGNQVAPVKNPYTQVIVAISVAMLVFLGLLGGLLAYLNATLNLGSAAVGDCLKIADPSEAAQRRTCANADANYVILTVTDSRANCVDAVGVTTAITANDKVLCAGAKGADVGQAVNGAQVGNCLLEQGGAARRSECGSGTREVLEIRRNQLRATGSGSDLATACLQVDGAERVYAWSLESSPKALIGTYDLIFCLGPKK